MENKRHILACESGYIKINGISLGLSPKEFHSALLEQGFTVVDKDDPIVLKGNIEGLGTCFVKLFGTKGSETEAVSLVIVITESKYNEDEMMVVFHQMEEDLLGNALYDDGGYGVRPKPHEINHFWDLDQGYVTIQWDGYNYSRGNEPNFPKGDGLDQIAIWLRKPLIKDEAYWRSEVD